MYRNSVFGKKGHVQNSSNDKFMTLQLAKGKKHWSTRNVHVQYLYLPKQQENIFTLRVQVKMHYLLHLEV